jgi:hypothetical protein
MAKPTLTIDREFQRILPPLNDEELRLLEEGIKQDGCEIPIVYWENDPKKETPIIDGMNRFYICQRLKLPYPTIGKKFPTKDAVIQWMRIRQLARRNLTDAARIVLQGQLYRDLKGVPGAPSKKGTMGHNVPITPTTVAELAQSEGVDRRTLQRAEKSADAVEAIEKKSPAVAAAILSEAIPLNAAPALAEASKAELKEVAAVIKTGDKKAIKEAVKEVIESDDDRLPWEDKPLKDPDPPPPDPIKDACGNIVHESVAEVFKAREHFKEAMQAVVEVKKKVHALMEQSAGGWIDGQEMDRLLTDAHTLLKFAAPHTECAKCRRAVKKSCPACKGTGWVHHAMYKSAFSTEDKEWLTTMNQ